jgi:hypothetical protein
MPKRGYTLITAFLMQGGKQGAVHFQEGSFRGFFGDSTVLCAAQGGFF